MVRNGFTLFLFLLAAGLVALGWALERDLSQPNYESILEGQMGRSPAFDSFAPNPNFADGATLRPPPEGTVIRGQRPLHYVASPEDPLRAGLDLHNPFAETDIARTRRGRTVFDNFCRVCHGPLGLGAGPVTQGGFPPPPSLLTDRSTRMPDGQMFHILTYGQGNMPSIAPQLSEQDRWAAILHVRSLQKLQAPYRSLTPITLQTVAGVFKQNCSACHGEDGTGNQIRKALPNIPDFTNLAWQVAQTEMAIMNQIDYGSQPLMPSFRYKLTRDEIQGLAVYVRSFPSRRAAEGQIPPPVASHLTAVSIYQSLCFACHDKTGHGDPNMRKSMAEIPDFTSAAWQKSRSNEELSHAILEGVTRPGKPSFMLPMKDKLGTVDVKEMVALIRGFEPGHGPGGKPQVIEPAPPKGPGPPAPERPIRTADIPKLAPPDPFAQKAPPPAPSSELAARVRMGAAIFQQYCIVCHGPDGTGGPIRVSMPAIPDFTNGDWQRQRESSELLASILNGKGTLMPANSGRVTPDQARDLVAYIRAFAPGAVMPGPVSDTEFARSFRQLQQQWDELEKELQKIRRP